MPGWPDKWDGVETFAEALRGCDIHLTSEVRALIEQWIPSRQDDPRDADIVPEEHMFDDTFTMRARLVDIHRRPILVGRDQVVCFYELHEQDHRLECLYFSTRPPGTPQPNTKHRHEQ